MWTLSGSLICDVLRYRVQKATFLGAGANNKAGPFHDFLIKQNVAIAPPHEDPKQWLLQI
jgi:hypothetical protein